MSTGTHTVMLPNGKEVTDVPVGYSKSQLIDKLLTNGVVSPEEAKGWMNNPTPSPAPTATAAAVPISDTPVADSLTLPSGMEVPTASTAINRQGGESMGDIIQGGWDSTVDAVSNNMDIPGGIAGAIAGAKTGGAVGSIGGPLGTAIGAGTGAILGGAGGTYGGSLLSDYFQGDELDHEKALEEAVISGAIDVATLGTAKVAKPVMKVMGFGDGEMFDIFRRTFDDQAALDPTKVGSDASLSETQKLLQEGVTDPATGEKIQGSLTAYQTGKASGARKIAEGIGEVGVFSGGRYADQAANNAQIIGTKLDELIDDALWQQTDDVGASVLGVIRAGKEANQQLYSDALDGVITATDGKKVNKQWLNGTINKFRKEGVRDSFGSIYDNETLKLMDEWQTMLGKGNDMPVSHLLDFQKKMNAKIDQLGSFGATQNKAASRELAQLASKMRETTQALLKNADPKAAEAYAAANKAFGEGTKAILPKLNSSVIARADKGDYAAIARALEGSNPNQIDAFMKSIDSSFQQARLAGIDVAEKTGFQTPSEIKAVVQNSYLRNLFGEVSATGFNPSKFRSYAAKFEKPKYANSAKAVLGPEKFAQFKRLTNAMSESAATQQGFIGSLVLRTKEANAASSLLNVGGQTGAASAAAFGLGGLSGPLAAAGIFLSPVVLARIASSPKSVTKLLNANKAADKAMKDMTKRVGNTTAGVNAGADIMNNAFAEIWADFTPEEQQDIRNDMRGVNRNITDELSGAMQ